MGLFGNKIKKIVQQIRNMNEYYSNDLTKDVKESFEDLKSEYEEYSGVMPEFADFAQQLTSKLDAQDANQLNDFVKRIGKVDRNAKNGVEAMYAVSRNLRRITNESTREFEELEY